MLWIGLTGSMGSGKSAVALILKELGFPVLDADVEAHAALGPNTPGLREVARVFGPGLLNGDGSLNRKALGQIVFANPQKLLQLEGIVHPIVQKNVQAERKKLAAAGAVAAFYDVPLLFEKKLESQFDKVVVVTAELEQMVERVRARSALSREDFLQRLQSQIPLAEKVKRADVVIKNAGTLEDLRVEVRAALKKLKL